MYGNLRALIATLELKLKGKRKKDSFQDEKRGKHSTVGWIGSAGRIAMRFGWRWDDKVECCAGCWYTVKRRETLRRTNIASTLSSSTALWWKKEGRKTTFMYGEIFYYRFPAVVACFEHNILCTSSLPAMSACMLHTSLPRGEIILFFLCYLENNIYLQ